MRFARTAAGLLASLVVSGSAWACPLECTKAADATWIGTYPATVQYTVRVSCPWAEHADYIATLTDSLLGAAFQPELPAIVVAGTDKIYGYDLAIPSYEACRALPGAQVGADGVVTVPNVVAGTTAMLGSSFTCQAAVACKPPGGGATRTPGWWKNRVDALAACVAGGVDLGYARITTVGEALGLLWANEGSYAGLDKARLKLARHTLVATCNAALLGGVPEGFSLAQAVALLASDDCAGMLALQPLVDAFNNQFDEVQLPAGFDPGPASGVAARRLAVPPTFPAGTCR